MGLDIPQLNRTVNLNFSDILHDDFLEYTEQIFVATTSFVIEVETTVAPSLVIVLDAETIELAKLKKAPHQKVA